MRFTKKWKTPPSPICLCGSYKTVVSSNCQHGYLILLIQLITLNIQDMLMTLSTLLRGSIYEKLRWTFKLYDLNGDGCITRSELSQIVLAIHELMGKRPQVRIIFQLLFILHTHILYIYGVGVYVCKYECVWCVYVCISMWSIYLRYLNGCLTVSRITKYENFVPSAN